MANEITQTFQITISKGDFYFQYAPGAINVDLSGDGGGNPGLVNVGTTEEVIDFGDVNPGLVFIRNLDSTNFVTYGIYNTGDGALTKRMKLLPNDIVHCFRLDASGSEELRMQADTAACKVEIRGFEA